MLPKKRGRPKKFTDDQLEAMEEDEIAVIEQKTKETMAYFTGNKMLNNDNVETLSDESGN
jgi:hypothetical protein